MKEMFNGCSSKISFIYKNNLIKKEFENIFIK